MDLNEKVAKVKGWFEGCVTADDRYQKIIEIGREAPKLNEEFRIPENRVSGCQSTMYLRSWMEGGRVGFQAEADALISAGLGALLTEVLSGEPPEVIVKWEPKYLEELGIAGSLSPNRANGLASLHLRMRQEALNLLVSS